MNKTKIDWCDSTWNPVTGCLHNCEYCYARRIANRFGSHENARTSFSVLNEPYMKDGKRVPFPFDFALTYHRYRLNEFINSKPRNIFVGSMTDLFGVWMPESVLKEVFEACTQAPQHRYLFLTKRPDLISRTTYFYTGTFADYPKNFWFGTTITSQKDLSDKLFPLLQVRGNHFLSIEPLLSELDMNRISIAHKDVLLSVNEKRAYYPGGGVAYQMPQWVIIGAETGKRNGKVIPKREWIEHIVDSCRKAKIPIFMKSSLQDIWNDELVQEYPW